MWSIRHFKHYLSCNPFTIITDHRPLLSLRKMDVTHDPTRRRGRWALELDPYQWTITHKDGKKHTNTDAMSRIPLRQDTTEVTVSALPDGHSSPENSVSRAELPCASPEHSEMTNVEPRRCCVNNEGTQVQMGFATLQQT